MKKAIGIFLLALLVSQFLPIKEVGKLLFNNQIVEEHPIDAGHDHVKMAKELKFCSITDDLLGWHLAKELKVTRFHSNENIPSSPSQEIHCPPPNGFMA